MKNVCLQRILLPAVTLMLAVSLPAQTANPPVSASAQSQVPKLPYGVEDVLKLSRAGMGEDVILNYVETSGTVYNLSPDNIVYLKKEGLSERVINKMLEQRRVAIQQTEKPVVAQPAPAPETATAQNQLQSPPPPPPTSPPVYSQPSVVVEPPSIQVAPYPYYPYYYRYPYYGWYRPYYGYYGGWYGPSLSLGFRFGGGHHWHHH